MIIRMWPMTPRRGSEQSAQGVALGTLEAQSPPCKGKRMTSARILLPFQGEVCPLNIPRVLPRADCFWPFRPSCRVNADNHFLLLTMELCVAFPFVLFSLHYSWTLASFSLNIKFPWTRPLVACQRIVHIIS